jgi:hypothetical protein
VHHADLGAMGPGRHVTHLPRGVFPSAGLYYVRLRQAGRVANTKVAIVR